MAGTKLVTTAVLLLLFWRTHQASAQDPLTVSISVNRTDPPGFIPESPTDYRAASGSQNVTCTATGGSGSGPTYQWSSTCNRCDFSSTTDAVIVRRALHSGDNGTHTCTATRGGETAMDSIGINIVGVGIHVFNGELPIGSQPNNGLVRPNVTSSAHPEVRRLRFFCRSDSTVRNVGELIGLVGTAITTTDVFEITTNGRNGGEIEVANFVTSNDVTSSEQGVYTCRIPLQSGVMREINIGIYPNAFNSVPTITNPLEFTPGSPSSTLTCTSTTSIATTITFMRDGNAINGIVRDGDSATVNGVTYQLSQTLTNRIQSTYDNMLSITEALSSLAGSTFTCQVENALGPSQASQSFQILDVEISVSYTPPPGFTPGPNEYRAASGPVVVTCTATGGSGSGDYGYEWTSTCSSCSFCSSGCDFRTSSTGVTSVITRTAVHSGDIGTHTCTASRGGDSASASIVFNVVGAGIHVFNGVSIGSQPNNGLVVPPNRNHHFFVCRSDSVTRNVGELIGPDGNPFSGNSYLVFDTPRNGGELWIVTDVDSEEPLPASEQGIYTCRIPLQSGVMVMINIGVYPIGYTSGPTVNDPLLFTPGSPSTVTCISTDSPATTVTFTRGSTTVGPLRDGESVVVDGVTYELAQRVINRRESTYENILTINDALANLVDDTFTCTVANSLGMDTSPSIIISVPLELSAVSSTTRLPNITPYNTFTLTCTATAPEGVVAPKTFTWRRADPADGTCGDSSVVGGNMDSNLEQPVSMSVLKVTVSETDIAVLHFCCQASIAGVSGTSNSVLSIDVVGPAPPVQPNDLTVISTDATTATVQWTVPLIAYTPETYVVSYSTGGLTRQVLMSDPVESGADFDAVNQMFSVELTGLEPNTAYNYQVVSSNTNGSNTSESESLNTTAADTGAGSSSDSIGIVGGVLGGLVALLLTYGVVSTIVNVVLMLRILRGKVPLDQPVYAGVDQTVEWRAMTKLRGPDIKTSECVAYGQAQPPSTDRAEDTTYEVIGNGN